MNSKSIFSTLLLYAAFTLGAFGISRTELALSERNYSMAKSESTSLASAAVMAWEHSERNGRSLRLSRSADDLRDYNMDNCVSSVFVADGYKATFYYNREYGGNCWLVVVGPYELERLYEIPQICQNKDWNDTISSVKISAKDDDEESGYYHGGEYKTPSKPDPDPGK